MVEAIVGGFVDRVVWHMLHPTELLGSYFRAHCRMEPVLETWAGTMVCEALQCLRRG